MNQSSQQPPESSSSDDRWTLDLDSFDRALGGEGWLVDFISDPLVMVLFALGLTLTAAVVGLFIARRRDRSSHGSANRRIARRLGLTAQQQRLVEDIATVSGYRHGASLLMSRGCFDHAVRLFAQRRRHDRAIATIRRRVFAR